MGKSVELQRLDRVMTDHAVRETGSAMSAYHFHGCYELYFVERGSVRFLINGSAHALVRGDFLLIPPHIFHCTRYDKERCVRTVVYFRQQDIGPRILRLLPEPGNFFSRPQIFRSPQENLPQFIDVLSRLIREEKQQDPQAAALMNCYLQELFLLLSRAGGLRRELSLSGGVSSEHVLLAARYIHLNYMNSLSAADIAAASGFSPNHLSKRFREAAGIGPHEFLILVRLQHAALALATTEDSITQIALRCGFSDSNYFKDVFKKHFGLTPREYRREQKESPR
jgi:AraC-like DNA-binding protein